MVWFQVNVPLVAGCLLMAALMNLRLFKLCLLVASILLMFLAAGVMVFGTKLGIIPANAVAVLSVMVWLGCVVSVIRRGFRSTVPYESFGGKADRTATCETALSGGAWMLDSTTGRLTNQIASEFHFNKLISGPSGSTLFHVVLGEAGWDGPIQLVRLDERDGRVLQARTCERRHPADRDWALTEIPIGDVSKARPVAASQDFSPKRLQAHAAIQCFRCPATALLCAREDLA